MPASLSELIDLALTRARASAPLDETTQAVRMALEHAHGAGDAAREDALARLSSAIADTKDLEQAASLALLCGALVEEGAPPTLALPAILGRLPRALEGATRFLEACREADDAAEADDRSCIERCGEHVAQRLPEEASAFRALENLCLPAIAMLSRSKHARKTLPGKESLLVLAGPLVDWHRGVRFLGLLLQVLDDEPLLVLHPASSRGWTLRISGIADGLQLHTLLADALIGDAEQGLISGRRPDPLVVAAAKGEPTLFPPPAANGAFNLVQWYGLDSQGAEGGVGDDSASWIWNEGVPADIARFEGVRTVLLTPPPYERSWNAERIFAGMSAEAVVIEPLSPDDVAARLRRMAHASAVERGSE